MEAQMRKILELRIFSFPKFYLVINGVIYAGKLSEMQKWLMTGV